MQQDEVAWNIISKQFCSFQVKTNTQQFCRNECNLTGFCSKRACPIANSQYATVRQENGIIFLYMKTAERNPFPAKHWEKVKLSRNYDKALYQIKENLLYWDRWVQRKCKQRFEKITQYLIRMRRLKMRRQKMVVPLAKKVERREDRREEKAMLAARIDDKIQKELMNRLKMGMYDEAYNYSATAFGQAVVAEELDEDSATNGKELCEEFAECDDSDTESESGVSKWVELDKDFESDDCLDMEDSVSTNMSLCMAKSECKNHECTSAEAEKKAETPRKRWKRKLEFELEVEAGPSIRRSLRY